MHARRLAPISPSPIRVVPSGDLVGRAAEVAGLRAALRAAESGRTGIVLLEGGPGIGKSRLLETVATSAAATGALVRRGRCYEADDAPCLWPWTQALGAASVQPAPTFDAMAAALRGLLESAEGRPLVVLLDDLHAADDASLRLLEFIARTTEDRPLLLAGAYRATPDGALDARLPELLRCAAVFRIVLAPLDRAALSELAQQLLGRRLPLAGLTALERQCGGNPWIARESLIAMQALGALAADADTVPLPEVVRTALTQRLAASSPGCRALLAQLAGSEDDVPLAALATALASDDDVAARAVREACTAGLTVATLERVRFASEAARAVAKALPAGTPTSGVVRLEGHFWTIAYGGRVVRLRDVRGMRLLAHLLYNPGREVHVVELGQALDGPGGGGVTVRDPGLSVQRGLGAAPGSPDARAYAAYRRRVGDLRGAIAEAEGNGDAAQAAAFEEELAALAHEIAQGHRGRQAASHVERARIAATKALRHALELIAETHPDLARHLAHSVRRGTWCVYAPDPRVPMRWSDGR